MAINNRQAEVLRFISTRKNVSISDLENHIEQTAFSDVSRITLIRDIDFLLRNRLIRRQGRARNTFYSPVLSNPLLEYFDVERCFAVDPDIRVIKRHFSFNVFQNLKGLFSSEDLAGINDFVL